MVPADGVGERIFPHHSKEWELIQVKARFTSHSNHKTLQKLWAFLRFGIQPI